MNLNLTLALLATTPTIPPLSYLISRNLKQIGHLRSLNRPHIVKHSSYSKAPISPSRIYTMNEEIRVARRLSKVGKLKPAEKIDPIPVKCCY